MNRLWLGRQGKGFADKSAAFWQEEISKSGGVRNDLEDQAQNRDNLRQCARSEAIQRRNEAPIFAAFLGRIFQPGLSLRAMKDPYETLGVPSASFCIFWISFTDCVARRRNCSKRRMKNVSSPEQI
jgi:hypothetical protein